MQRLLIIGGEQLVGSNLAAVARERFETHVCTPGGRWPAAGCHSHATPQPSARSLGSLCDRVSPDWIVYNGPFSAANWEEAPESLALSRELALLDALCSVATQRDVPLTVVSSDALFAAPGMFHHEQSPLAARGPRAEAARAVENTCAGRATLLARTHAYGWSLEGLTLVEQIYAALTEGRPMPIDAARYSTPVLATDLAEMLIAAYDGGLQGVYHFAGAERANPLRFGCELASVLGCDSTLYGGRLTTPDEFNPLSKQETSLDSRAAMRALERPAPMIREGLMRFVEQASNGYRDQLRGLGVLQAA